MPVPTCRRAPRVRNGFASSRQRQCRYRPAGSHGRSLDPLAPPRSCGSGPVEAGRGVTFPCDSCHSRLTISRALASFRLCSSDLEQYSGRTAPAVPRATTPGAGLDESVNSMDLNVPGHEAAATSQGWTGPPGLAHHLQSSTARACARHTAHLAPVLARLAFLHREVLRSPGRDWVHPRVADSI